MSYFLTELPVRGGMLTVVVSDGKISCEYKGTLPKETAVALLKDLNNIEGTAGMTVNGVSPAEWLESLA